MAYFKIGDKDFSSFVNALKVRKEAKYNALTNAAGNTVIDYINSKRVIEVGIIPLTDAAMVELMAAIGSVNVSISFHNPVTNALEENVNCIITQSEIEHYTIQVGKVLYKAFNLQFVEL